MKEFLTIRNFKCFINQTIELRDLTVLVGANGMGKSTIIQSLLLLRQSAESQNDSILLNGPYSLSLGTYDSIASHSSNGNISFKLSSSRRKKGYLVEMEGTNETESYAMRKNVIRKTKSDSSLFSPSFYFLSAERNGPRISQKMLEMNIPTCGFYGERTAQILSNQYFKIDKGKCHKDCKSPFLKDQVNAWLNFILPNNEVTAESNYKLQTAQILIKNAISDNYIESTNLGFGISYCLPIIVSGLIAQQSSYMIIENPEAHLHPTAQTRMGKFLAHLSHCGIKIIIETHSDHLLDGIQIEIAQNPTFKDNVIINNFGIKDKKVYVTPILYNNKIEYSEWPEGFMDSTYKNYSEYTELKK